MIEVRNLTKRFGKLLANDGVSLVLGGGELGVLLGPNGAGKSTLIKSVCGLLRFEGEISVCGHGNRSLEAKRLLGYVPEIAAPYPMLTVGEHMEFIARAYRLDESWRGRADALLARFDMADKRHKLCGGLSKGMKQKVSVCCALLPEPRVVVLDEPLSGLDPHGIKELTDCVAEIHAAGASLLLSTHMLDTVEGNWDKVFIMKAGKIARVCRRGDGGESLKDIYFSLFEQGRWADFVDTSLTTR